MRIQKASILIEKNSETFKFNQTNKITNFKGCDFREGNELNCGEWACCIVAKKIFFIIVLSAIIIQLLIFNIKIVYQNSKSSFLDQQLFDKHFLEFYLEQLTKKKLQTCFTQN